MAEALDLCAAFAARYAMLPQGGKVLCAVSGGADSVCLLHVMRALGEKQGFAVAAAHFDHRLRGAESARDAEFVKKLCARLGVEFFPGSGDVAAYAGENSLGIEEAARRLRYAFLEDAAARCGAVRIATGHTGDDNAETMLLNLARGAGSRGLAGIPPVRGGLIRPLLCLTRSQVEDFLNALGESWVTDSSNLRDDYARNRLRHAALPALRETNPRFIQHALDAAERLRRDEEFLSALAEEFIEAHGERLGEAQSLPAKELAALPRPISARVLRQLCGDALDAGHREALLSLAASGQSGAAADVPGMRVRLEYDRLVFPGPEGEKALPPRELGPNETLELPEAGLTVRRWDEALCEVHNSFNIFFFKKTEVCGKILVRSFEPGDKLRLPGRGCTKSLRKLFQERRVPLSRRGLIPVLADERGALAVYGFGADARCAAQAGERAIKIELAERRAE